MTKKAELTHVVVVAPSWSVNGTQHEKGKVICLEELDLHPSSVEIAIRRNRVRPHVVEEQAKPAPEAYPNDTNSENDSASSSDAAPEKEAEAVEESSDSPADEAGSESPADEPAAEEAAAEPVAEELEALGEGAKRATPKKSTRRSKRR